MKNWDAKEYKKNFSFVTTYGEDLFNLISKKGGNALDVGCGNGKLTKNLKNLGFEVLGIDSSKEMIDLAKKEYNDISFLNESITDYKKENTYDLIFSNAVMHWIKDQNSAISNIASSLKVGGEFICEFGGYLCANSIHSTLKEEFEKLGYHYNFTFYFPKISEYTTLLEKHGLTVKYAILFDRPTPLPKEQTVIDWINMFVTEAFKDVGLDDKEIILNNTLNKLKDTLYKDGVWIIDYTRIRIKAIK